MIILSLATDVKVDRAFSWCLSSLLWAIWCLLSWFWRFWWSSQLILALCHLLCWSGSLPLYRSTKIIFRLLGRNRASFHPRRLKHCRDLRKLWTLSSSNGYLADFWSGSNLNWFQPCVYSHRSFFNLPLFHMPKRWQQ